MMVEQVVAAIIVSVLSTEMVMAHVVITAQHHQHHHHHHLHLLLLLHLVAITIDQKTINNNNINKALRVAQEE
jgi:hypothetical protein